MDHDFFMRLALQEAAVAFEEGEIPVGAIVVAQNVVIARAHNQTERLKDVTAHAEMLAITSAADFIGGKYLKNCTLYVTLEPCLMCAGALFWAQIGQVVYGATDEKRGFQRTDKSILHPKTVVVKGVMKTECEKWLKLFFQHKRK